MIIPELVRALTCCIRCRYARCCLRCWNALVLGALRCDKVGYTLDELAVQITPPRACSHRYRSLHFLTSVVCLDTGRWQARANNTVGETAMIRASLVCLEHARALRSVGSARAERPRAIGSGPCARGASPKKKPVRRANARVVSVSSARPEACVV